MTRLCIKGTIALALFATGWVTAKAQSAAPTFELIVDAPGGPTSITCVRGCTLAWVERGVNPNAEPVSAFDYSCTAPRCSSGKVGGWITP
jgi:hypothetical protein